MEHKTRSLAELKSARETSRTINALIGVDGFVDKIVHPVDQRTGPGDDFRAIESIPDFAKRIESAAGKSANIELAPVMEKLGGNGPIMANAQHAHGLSITYLGALGREAIHPVFESFAARTQAISVADPGVTHALEFEDGKLLLGSMASLDAITYEHLCDVVGEAALIEHFDAADEIALVNWTMIPYLTDVFRSILSEILPKLPTSKPRTFFFDLADPEKRSKKDLLEVLDLLKEFESFGTVILGLNLREAEQVHTILEGSPLEYTPENLQQTAATIRSRLSVSTVVVHPIRDAACATEAGTAYVTGPRCDDPKITTGAGDHFNSGFVTAHMLGLSPEACLTLAVATSGFYVRTAESPSLDDLQTFISSW